MVTPVKAVTIDEYIDNAEGNGAWINSICGRMVPVESFDPNEMLVEAFKSTSLQKGIPGQWDIIEHKRARIGGLDYYFIRFIAFKKEHIFVFDLRESIKSEFWCVRR
jgi:hypothetical protein